MSAEKEKWTEIEHLPEWDEEFYQVFTAKKHGKWVMLKALRPELAGQEKYQKMIEREFDTRYNLAHAHIVMINDYEEVPGVGMAIITDDVYGKSLASLIREGKVTEHHVSQLCHEMVEAMYYIQANHIVHKPLTADRVIFTDKIENLKLIDVGYDQNESLTPAAAGEDIAAFGKILKEALDACATPYPHLEQVAQRCMDKEKRYSDLPSLRVALAGRNSRNIYMLLMAFMAAMLVFLIILTLVQ